MMQEDRVKSEKKDVEDDTKKRSDILNLRTIRVKVHEFERENEKVRIKIYGKLYGRSANEKNIYFV